jgi:hypothetical protein
MRFINALDVIFRLVAAWKLFDNFENTSWHKPTDRRVDGHHISDLEFMGRHRFLAPFLGRITVVCHLNWNDGDSNTGFLPQRIRLRDEGKARTK